MNDKKREIVDQLLEKDFKVQIIGEDIFVEKPIIADGRGGGHLLSFTCKVSSQMTFDGNECQSVEEVVRLFKEVESFLSSHYSNIKITSYSGNVPWF